MNQYFNYLSLIFLIFSQTISSEYSHKDIKIQELINEVLRQKIELAKEKLDHEENLRRLERIEAEYNKIKGRERKELLETDGIWMKWNASSIPEEAVKTNEDFYVFRYTQVGYYQVITLQAQNVTSDEDYEVTI